MEGTSRGSSVSAGRHTALRHGSIDLGLVGQEAAVLTREFYWRRIARLPLVVAVPENHRLAGGEADKDERSEG
jgi:DNA-binding transcriptional LysR family regulator